MFAGLAVTFLVVVAGVPGVGKSTLASRLVRKFHMKYIGLAEIALEEGAWTLYDSSRRTFYIDFVNVAKALRRRVRKGQRLLLEATELLTPWEAGIEPVVVLVLRCNPISLFERLKSRDWPLRKLVENIEAEFVGVVSWQARYLFGDNRVCEIETSRRSPEDVFKLAVRFLVDRDNSTCDNVDWTLSNDVADFVLGLVNKFGNGYAN